MLAQSPRNDNFLVTDHCIGNSPSETELSLKKKNETEEIPVITVVTIYGLNISGSGKLVGNQLI